MNCVSLTAKSNSSNSTPTRICGLSVAQQAGAVGGGIHHKKTNNRRKSKVLTRLCFLSKMLDKHAVAGFLEVLLYVDCRW